MVKPVLTPIGTITPVFIQDYERYLPTAFDEGLSILQKLNKVIKHLQEIGELTIGLADQWNELIKWITDEGIEETIIPIMEQWYTEGKFDSFFNQAIEELKILRNSSFVGGIAFKKIHYRVGSEHTSVWLTDVPYLNEDGTKNILKRGFANDSSAGGTSETARKFSDRHMASAVLNGSTFNVSTNVLDGHQISNGIIVKNDNNQYPWKWYLGIDVNGLIKTYSHETTAQFMINDGMKEVLTAFYPIIVNGAKVSRSVWEAQGSTSPFDPHVRQVIAQRNNNDYVILTSGGSLNPEHEKGMGMDDIYTVLMDNYNDIKTAYVLDGGGSAQTVVYGTMLNRPFDGAQTTERPVPDFLYFGKEILSERDTNIYDAYKTIGYLRKELLNLESKVYYGSDQYSGYIRLKAPVGFSSQGIESWDGENRNGKLLFNQSEIYYYDYINQKYIMRFLDGDIYTEKGRLGKYFDDSIPTISLASDDLNTITRSGEYWATIVTTNTPDSLGSWRIEHVNLNESTCMQIATSYTTPFPVKRRRKSSGVWSAWA